MGSRDSSPHAPATHHVPVYAGSRVNDSTQQWAAFKPAPADGPAGAYQFTPNQTYALYPQLANATTFATPTAAPVPSQQFGATVRATHQTTSSPCGTPELDLCSSCHYVLLTKR